MNRKMRRLLLHVCVLAVVVGIPSKAAKASTRSFSESIAAKLDELQNLGYSIDPEELLESLTQLSEGKFLCSGVRNDNTDMKRHWLRNDTVTCNDGSRAGYYIRKADVRSDRWLVFLEGGWFCFDHTSCKGRWINTPHLMSSKQWPPSRKGSGILSWDQKENPFLHDANIVYVPYCSSDSWSGTRKARSNDQYSFLGAYIVEAVIRDLVADHGLDSASYLYLAGSSAGGTGVLVNLDRVASLMSVIAPHVKHIRGIADSGWFLDNKQYKATECTDVHSCAPVDGVERGIQLWKGLVPDKCKSQNQKEHWRCYFGYRIYPTLKTPVFVVQHLFDEAQITADNVGPPVKKEQWQYIHNMGQDMKQTLINVSAVFAPACLSHILITRSEWHKVSINGVTLPDALKCWESGQHERNSYHKRRKASYLGLAHQLITGESPRKRNNVFLSDAPDSDGSRHRNKKDRKKKQRKDRDGQNKKKRRRTCKRKRDRERERGRDRERSRGNVREIAYDPYPTESLRIRRSIRDPRTRVGRMRRAALFDHHDIHHMRYHSNQCNHHRLDHCAWPQCNYHCPKIHNPFTGEEMDFIDLLMQFGLDLSSIAEALGMDLPTLQSMDHKALLRLLMGETV